jgi:hypothetical protein
LASLAFRPREDSGIPAAGRHLDYSESPGGGVPIQRRASASPDHGRAPAPTRSRRAAWRRGPITTPARRRRELTAGVAGRRAVKERCGTTTAGAAGDWRRLSDVKTASNEHGVTTSGASASTAAKPPRFPMAAAPLLGICDDRA